MIVRMSERVGFDAARRAENGARLSFVVTVVVVAIKLVGGWMSNSASVLAEAFQSSVDVIASFGIWQAIRVASRPADDTHPYGHGKAEVLMSAAQLVLILGASGFILLMAVQRLTNPEPLRVDIGLLTLGVTALINVAISAYLARVAAQTNSSGLRTEVLHLRGDLFSVIGVLLGLALVRLTGAAWLDPAVAIVFTLVVIVAAIRQMISVIHTLMDGALPDNEIQAMEAVLRTHPDVRGFHNVRTRALGTSRYVELHVLLDDDLSFVRAHDMAEHLEADLSATLGGATVSIHYEPYEAEMAHRAEKHGDKRWGV